jgi:hypothetical protein
MGLRLPEENVAADFGFEAGLRGGEKAAGEGFEVGDGGEGVALGGLLQGEEHVAQRGGGGGVERR